MAGFVRRSAVMGGLVAVALALPGAAVAVSEPSSSGPEAPPAGLVAAAVAPPATAMATLVRRVHTSGYTPPSSDASDITYVPSENRLLLSDGEVEEIPALFAGVNLWRARLDGTQPDSGVRTGSTLAYSREPAGLAYDSTRNALLVADDDTESIYTVTRGADLTFGTADDGVEHFKVAVPGIGDVDPESVAVDTSVTPNRLYVADAMNAEVYQFSLSGTYLSSWDVGYIGAVHPEGLTYDAVRDRLLLLDDGTCRVYELAKDGSLLDVVDIGAARCSHSAGITVAPASSGNGRLSMYIVDRRRDNDSNPAENDGLLEELSSPTLSAPPNAAPTAVMTARPGPGPAPEVVVDATASTDVDGWGITRYRYTFGDGTAAVWQEEPSATHVYAASGTYTVTVTARDAGGLTDRATARVTVNRAPSVDAGADLVVRLPDSAQLHGSAADDGWPAPATLSTRWTQVSGPAESAFAQASSPRTTSSFPAAGRYVLRLTADDSVSTAFDDVTVTVDAPAPPQTPPAPPAPPTAPPAAGPAPPAPGASPAPSTVVPASGPAIHAVQAVRILDTRRGAGVRPGKLRPGRALTLQVEGRGGLPSSGVDAATLRITVPQPRARGYLTVWPARTDRPATKSLRFQRGVTVSRLVTVAVGSNGKIRIYNGSRRPVHVRAVTTAWFGTATAGGAG